MPPDLQVLPLHGFTSHSLSSSNLGYLSSSKLLTLYYHLSLHLSLLALKDSNPIAPLTASLHVLEEQPSIFLAAPSRIDSKGAACLLLQAHTSLPYSKVGRSTETNNTLLATVLILPRMPHAVCFTCVCLLSFGPLLHQGMKP